MKIQQHDGVVVEATVVSARLRQAQGHGGVSREGEGSASTYPCRSRAETFKRTGLMESYSS